MTCLTFISVSPLEAIGGLSLVPQRFELVLLAIFLLDFSILFDQVKVEFTIVINSSSSSDDGNK